MARESYDRTIIYRLELIPWRIGLQVESYIMLFACSKTRRGSLGRSRISRGHYREIFLRKKAKRTRKVPFFITIRCDLITKVVSTGATRLIGVRCLLIARRNF